jgi:hypothetical protein
VAAIVGIAQSALLLGRRELDQVEVLLAPDQQPAATAALLRTELGPDYTVAPLPAREAGAAGAAAVRVSVELAAWLALGLGALALAAAAGDRVRAMASELALQRALGVPPWWLSLQVLLPSILMGALAGSGGALLGPAVARVFVPGLQAWLQAQTGTGISIELPPASGLFATGLMAGSLAGLVAACWAGRATALAAAAAELRAPVGAAGRPALAVRRAAHGALCLLAVLLLCWSGATGLGAPLRALDAVLAVSGIALLAGPSAALLARAAGRAVVPALAAGRIRRTPGRALSALQVFAVAAAVSLGLLGVRSSVAAAAPELARQRCGGDLVVVRASALLGLPAAPLAAASIRDALLGMPALAGSPEAAAGDSFQLHLDQNASVAAAAAEAARRLGPLGDIAVLDGVRLRASFLAAVQLALDSVAMLVWLLLGVAAVAGAAFLAADFSSRGREAAAFAAVGGSPLQRVAVDAVVTLLLASAAALLALPGGLWIGASWTAGPLQHALGVPCRYVPPDGVVLATACAMGLGLLALFRDRSASPAIAGRTP